MKFRSLSTVAVCILTGVLVGCGSTSSSAVNVQSVEMTVSMCGNTQEQVFTGIVSTGNEANIKKDSNKSVAKVNVKKGDLVKAGDVLFTYDAEQAKNSLEKAKLELEEQKNTLTSKEEEKAQLEADKKKAGQNEQLDYTIKIQEADTDIRETKYNIGLKEKEIESLEKSTQNLDVTAPFDGRIELAGVADAPSAGTTFSGGDEEDGGLDNLDVDDEGTGETFIRLVETDNYRVKGTINETNIDQIHADMTMIIHSRTDDTQTWTGVVSTIERKTPNTKTTDDSFGEETENDEMGTTSSYPFYVKIDSLEGLMIGQHVYMTEDKGDLFAEGEIRLPSNFINDADADPFVWAENNGQLEKRTVELGDYDESTDTYTVLDGLTMEDYIAEGSDSYEAGMAAVRNDRDAFQKYIDSIADETPTTGKKGEDEEEEEGDFDEEDIEEDLEDDLEFEDIEEDFGEVVG
ncbi:MAG: efflux RND transporter periplasmic adaptor subunit [Lachnospiraceae bacterium]|nr:efflux RND transporter periplasmic adaptor subunit [Lachnospiraceae bacterium]